MPAIEFKAFYKSVLNLAADDFDRFIAAIETPLPSTFRVTQTPDTPLILQRLDGYPFLTKIRYLDGVYTFDLKEKTPEYKEFTRFLVGQTDIGNIQRQEVVSMLPHLFLDVRRDSLVLETCASPGSKTKQLLEIVKDGLVVSNDKSPSRVNVLISESFKKASSSFLVTMADAAQLPNTGVRFDRICCDVPCTSDGTVRKNRPVLDKWSVQSAIGLSSLQYRILERSLEQLADSGILVYSTCSLNPIENEYVINRVIAQGKYELVLDTSRVQYSEGDPSKITVRTGITSFAYEGFSFENKELEKCIRILPQDQNTGGFFIATLRRKVPRNTAAPSTEKEVDQSGRIGCGFYNVPQPILSQLMDRFKPSGNEAGHFVSLTKNFKNIFCLSDSAYSFVLNNPKLKVLYAGIKAFSLTDLGDCSYRAKGPYMECCNTQTDFTGTTEDFKALVRDKVVSTSLLSFSPAGHFSLSIAGLRYKFCGFGSENKVFLYIDDAHRRAFSALYLE